MRSDKSMSDPLNFSSGPVPLGLKPQTHRPPSPVPSCVSMRSDKSMSDPLNFSSGPVPLGLKPQTHRPPSPVPSCVSMRSDKSMSDPLNFSSGPVPLGLKPQTHRPPSPVPSCVSMRSDKSMSDPPNFSSGPVPLGLKPQTHRPPSPVPSCVSMRSDKSMSDPRNFSSGPVPLGLNEMRADLILCGLRNPVITTCAVQCISSYWEQSGLPREQTYPSCGKTCGTQPVDMSTRDEHTGLINSKRHLHTEKPLKKSRKRRELDEDLRRVKENHKASLKRRFKNISEGIIKPGAEILLNKIYTDLYITEGESEGVNKEHEVWQVESASRPLTTEDTPINCNDIFKPLPGQERFIRIVMTKGVAGIGKTVSVQKFILDWTDGVANQTIDFIFPLSFRELNLVRGGQYSLHRLLLEFHPELKELNDDEGYKDCQVVFIFDGLDESRLTLDLEQNSKLSDVKQTSSVDVLMTSLIQRTLLPSALIWITSRPAAASQIPAQCIDQVTEVRGFNDPQKDEYFRKRIGDESQANKIISHIKASRSLHIMCHIPVFCWIAATVLQQMLEQENTQEIPKTLTEMFIHFLLIQTTRKNLKYEGRCEGNNKKLLESHKSVILKLAELAFKNLLQGNLMFYEEDLRECGIDVSQASVYSGMCTEIFKEESVFQQKKVYCFVHLSIQEFLAALHVFVSFKSMNEKLGAPELFVKKAQLPLEELLEKAADKALQSKNGHLDLFLRFIMGISLERNHRLLQGLLRDPLNSSESIRKTCKYIKELNKEDLSPERCINLFFCLLEMKDNSMHQEIKKYLESPKEFKGQLSPAHCSALAHVILMSEEVLDEFDLKKYNTSDEGRRRLIPAMKCFSKALFSECKLSDKSCGNVASVLQSPNSLIELDLSNNDLGDSGVQLVSKGLSSPHCRLHTLRLAGCRVREVTCEVVASILHSPSSLVELDLSDNDLGDSGVQLLSKGLSSPHCKLKTLRLSCCQISDDGYVCLALTLMLNPSCVKELDVSNNHPGESAQKLLSATLNDPHHKVEALRFAECKLSDESFGNVASVLQSPNSLIELDLGNNDLGDSRVQLLSKGLSSTHCKLQTLRLAGCTVTEKTCETVASILDSQNSLVELDLSDNELGDSGVQLLSKGLSSPHCKLKTLRLSCCQITDEGYVCLALTLMLNPSCVKELDVSNNSPGESAQKLFSATLEDPHHKVQAMRLADCRVTENTCGILASILRSPNSLVELDLSTNDLGNSGIQLLSKGLCSPHCKLKTLRLAGCKISSVSCKILTSVLQTPNSLIELDLSKNGCQDYGVVLLCKGLNSHNCKLQILRLAGSELSSVSCKKLTSVLQSPNSLIELDISKNDFRNDGVDLLSEGLRNPNCKLQILRLSNCGISDEGYVCLALTLMLNPSCVKELDLSKNHPGESAYNMLSATLEDPQRKIETLKLAGCELSYVSCKSLGTVLQSPNSLIEVDLSYTGIGDKGVELLSEGLRSPNCKLQILTLRGSEISDKSCGFLASALKSNRSHLKKLDLCQNHLGRSVLNQFSATLKDRRYAPKILI
ncbi:NACHT, LRR and PYD domains-containing protein 3-like isoform X1 [Alosa alosa]|uniref:NACHT, LRR and PYD domains-containing protein 3-like isoform X1 n=3 Tax=Alosa alosa TaxID=278164 RepID=UPI00201521E2|nr:NACHT, LRR and PYD domains-containing protein 3-like isoform X1 [Alosa alosa]